MASRAPIMMPLSRCGAATRVTTKVAAAIRPSARLAFQMWTKAPGVSRPTTASRMITASTALGRWWM